MRKRSIAQIILIALITIGVLTGLFFLGLDIYEPIKDSLSVGTWVPLQEKFSEYGIFAWLIISFLQAIFILVPFMPATPLHIIAGVVHKHFYTAFLTIMSGIVVGNTILFIIVKLFGPKIQKFYSRKEHKSLSDLETSDTGVVLSKRVILLYLFPVVSYGLIAYTCAKSNMKYIKYIIITTLGTIPSVVLAIALGNYVVNAKVFLILIASLLILTFLTMRYQKLLQRVFKKRKKKDMKFFQNNVRKPSKFLFFIFRIFLSFTVIRKVNLNIKGKEVLKGAKGPALLLYNHPSFYDWMYAYLMFYPTTVNSINAYNYFCNYKLGKLLYKIGGFPKFLYQPDLAAIKNIKRVMKFDGILGLAPEGRLSAYGTMETIAPATEKLLKHLAVDVYLVKLDGSYLTRPKWAKDIRPGRIDVNVSKIFSAKDFKDLTPEEIEAKLNKEMYYDDFAWQEENQVYYKSKKIAEGLENILYLCPVCESEFTYKSSGNSLSCRHCKTEVFLDNYYNFHSNKKEIPKNIRDWYLLQKEYEAKNILVKDYKYSSHVTLKIPDPKGKGFTVAGDGITSFTLDGLTYSGTLNNEEVNLEFKTASTPAIPFGANENFEIHANNTLYYFIPDDPKHSVKYSVIGEAIYNKYLKDNEK